MYKWAVPDTDGHLVIFSFPPILEYGIAKFFVLSNMKRQIESAAPNLYVNVDISAKLLTIKITPEDVESFIWVSKTSSFSS